MIQKVGDFCRGSSQKKSYRQIYKGFEIFDTKGKTLYRQMSNKKKIDICLYKSMQENYRCVNFRLVHYNSITENPSSARMKFRAQTSGNHVPSQQRDFIYLPQKYAFDMDYRFENLTQSPYRLVSQNLNKMFPTTNKTRQVLTSVEEVSRDEAISNLCDED